MLVAELTRHTAADKTSVTRVAASPARVDSDTVTRDNTMLVAGSPAECAVSSIRTAHTARAREGRRGTHVGR